MVRVVVGVKPETARVLYEENPLRYLDETIKNLLKWFRGASNYGIMADKHLVEETQKRRKWATARVQKEARSVAGALDATTVGVAADTAGKDTAMVDAMAVTMGEEHKKKESQRRT
jgi:hypothetical protein